MGKGVTLPATGFPHNESFLFVHSHALKGPGGDPKRTSKGPILPYTYTIC